MNNICLIGRLTADPDIKYTESDMCVAKYVLAVDRQYKRDDDEQTADFFPCVCFGSIAEFVEKHLHKGIKIGITGRIQIENYTDEDDNPRSYTKVYVGSHTFCESKKDDESSSRKSSSRKSSSRKSSR